jgi:maltooligosyltrehalose trehalohydrolase
MQRFIVCLQNHDQVGNRALGERLHHQVTEDAWRAASTVLLTVPMTPLLFMGQEWAASTPFQFFTDLDPAFGRMVTEGRRQEFADFPEFSNTADLSRVPDPQAPSTFEASRLDWAERTEPAHARVLALYRALLALRLDEPALGASEGTAGEAWAPDESSILIRRSADESDGVIWIAARFRGTGAVDFSTTPFKRDTLADVLLTTEDAMFAADPMPPQIDAQPDGPIVRFARPGAVILKTR